MRTLAAANAPSFTVDSATLSASVRTLLEHHEGLALNAKGQLEGKGLSFVEEHSDQDIAPLPGLSSIAHGAKMFHLVPAAVDLPPHLERHRHLIISDAAVLSKGVATLAETDGLPIGEVVEALNAYGTRTLAARLDRAAKRELARSRTGENPLFAGALPIEAAAPMLVDGLVKRTGVSVFFGAFDEFKTTTLLDMAVHISMGSTWQGRQVTPRPVVWYALEGADEIPVRVRALEAKIRGAQAAWGNDFAPIVVRNRIPESAIAWRTELASIKATISNYIEARKTLGELEQFTSYDGAAPVVVIDTLSIALGGDDEKGPRAAGFIAACLDLLKARDDLDLPDFYEDKAGEAEWIKQNPGREASVDVVEPVAEHVLIAHHQTKTGTDFAGNRTIGDNTHGLYRVHRFGKMSDRERPYAGQLTPLRVKGIARPAAMRFEVEVVPVEGTEQTAAILKDRAAEIPGELAPVIAALRELPDHGAITPSDLNDCLDLVAGADGRTDAAKRQARKRSRDQLEEAGVIEPIEDDGGKVVSYRFHDPA
jgi:hypothetical protein